MSCPVCGDLLRRGKNVRKTIPYYECTNPDCPVIKIHAHRNLLSGMFCILRIVKDSRFSGNLTEFGDLVAGR